MGSPSLLLPQPIYQEILFVLSLKYALLSPSPHYSKQWSSLSFTIAIASDWPACFSFAPYNLLFSQQLDWCFNTQAIPYSCSIQDPPKSSTLMYCKTQRPSHNLHGSAAALTSSSTFYLHFDHWPLSCPSITPGILGHRAFALDMLSVYRACLWDVFMAHAFTSFWSLICEARGAFPEHLDPI